MEEGITFLQSKKTNPRTYEALKDTFEELEKEKKEKNLNYKSGYDEHLQTYDSYEKSEKNRGRMEYRKMQVSENVQTQKR